MVLIRWSTVLCLLAAVIATAVAFAPAVSPFLTRIKHAPSSSPLWALKDDFHTIWKRLDDTVEASGVAEDYPDHPPLVQRGFGFRRFLIIMAVGMLYKWYRARFINKVRISVVFNHVLLVTESYPHPRRSPFGKSNPNGIWW
jgi:hypothetical protein